MKVRITVTNDSGETFQGEMDLGPAAPRKRRTHTKAPAPVPTSGHASVNLNLPLRPFLKKYARGKSGAAKLTLLIAHMAGGKTDVAVDSGELQATWNRATAFLGEYNRAHSTRAKDNGWIDSSKHGQYVLQPCWNEAAS